MDVRGKFDPVPRARHPRKYPITTWCAPPTALRLIVRQDLSRWRFPRLRHCVTAGEPLNPEVFNRWRDATGLDHPRRPTAKPKPSCWSATSAPLAAKSVPAPWASRHPGFTIAFLTRTCSEVPAGRKAKSPCASPAARWGSSVNTGSIPTMSATKFRGDWYLTGDRASRDADGYFWFVGRSDDVIKSSGYRIGPFEVESALLEHPAVLESPSSANPMHFRGQIVKAFVVLRPGTLRHDRFESRQLQSHCKKSSPPTSIPREIEFVAETAQNHQRQNPPRRTPPQVIAPHRGAAVSNGPAAAVALHQPSTLTPSTNSPTATTCSPGSRSGCASCWTSKPSGA